ncbi:hypothetical protein [Candidatus Tisiphia endosymbiont of Ceraclea dissimilis]|uniref:hypothetical protein n=1 Tax=Candidatus Tisiphia endosymbiont of Ceraclea dissimilis TaxID=3077928 RepID=UPI003CCB09FA
MSKDNNPGIGKTDEGIKIWTTPEEWKKIRESIETAPDKRDKQEQEKKPVQKYNNDQNVYCVTEIKYDNHSLNDLLTVKGDKDKHDLKYLIPTALSCVPPLLDADDTMNNYGMIIGTTTNEEDTY